MHRNVALLEAHHGAEKVKVANGCRDVGQVDRAVAILAVRVLEDRVNGSRSREAFMVEGQDFDPKSLGLHRFQVQYSKLSSSLMSCTTHLKTVGGFLDLADLGCLPSLLVVVELELDISAEDFL